MRSSALGTPDTADPKETGTIRKEDAPFIVNVDGQTGRMPAGACQPVEREAVYDGIVISLRKLIVITDRNEYHSLVRHSLMTVTGYGTADELFQGGSAVLFYSNETNDTTKGTAWNNLSENMSD